MRRFVISGLLAAGAAFGQAPTAPVVTPRGVVNAYSRTPAPSRVTPGGIIWITGLNLGPAEGAKASGLPLPTELAGVQVLINNRPAPLFAVSPSQIEAQVPLETTGASATVVVRRGDASSRPARINIVQLDPALRSAEDRGFGAAAATASNNTIVVKAIGLGLTNPRAVSGEAGPEGATLVNPLRAYVGGLRADASASPSVDRPGEFDIAIKLPEGARPGDHINVVVGNNVAATPRRVWDGATQSSVQYLPLPPGSAPDLRALAASDLRGGFAMAAGPRQPDGCYTAYRIDFTAMQFTTAEPCVTAGNPNQINPFVPALEGSSLAALGGPPSGQLPNGVSSKLVVFSATAPDAMKADLPAAATNIVSQNGDFRAVLTTTNPNAVLVDAETAQVGPAPPPGPGAGGAVPGAGGVGGGVAALCLNPTLTVDLGDGLTKIVSCAQVNAQMLAAVIADDENAPKKAKFATLSPQGQVMGSVEFPAGVLPLILPPIPLPPGGGPGGQQLAVLNRIRALTIVDGNVLYVLARAADGSSDSFLAFGSNSSAAPAVLPFPSGWYAAACTPQLRVFSLDLARQVGIPATKAVEKDAKANCPAFGLVLLNRDNRQVTISESPARDGYNAASQAGDLADFIYTVSTNPQRTNIAESLFVMDGTSGSSFRLDLPPGVVGFGQLREEPGLLALLAPANATQTGTGDAGIAVFDIESASARLLPTPEGFASVNLLAIFESTRKVVARGTRPGNAGSAILIYDLVNGDLFLPEPPAGCTFAGLLPPAAPGGGIGGGQPQPQVNLTAVNPKANNVLVGCYDSNRRLTGFLNIRSN